MARKEEKNAAWNRERRCMDRSVHQDPKEHKWNGWGYEDTRLTLDKDGHVRLTGHRYSHVFPAARVMRALRPWAEKTIGLNLNKTSFSQEKFASLVTPPQLNEAFLQAISHLQILIATDDDCRLRHSHGHTCLEIYKIRHGSLKRVPDVVLYPKSHEDVEQIIQSAVTYNVCIIPFGGGTSVTNALECEIEEKRMIVSLDMRQMCSIVWVDKENKMACIEAGMSGQEIDQQLSAYGLVLGHQPDSNEFSTLGGWIATRASGMKKNVYGNIEDLIVNIRMVSPNGTLSKSFNAPRASVGPDLNHIILGSEGTLGVITCAIVRLKTFPQIQEYESLLFPDFASGVETLRQVAHAGCTPASFRLLDNIQFQFGQALKPCSSTPVRSYFVDKATRFYLTKYKGFNPTSMCAATLLLEGTKEQVMEQKKKIFQFAKQHGAMQGGEENGKRGYFLTYIIAYLRDFAFDYYFMSESFETALPWDQVLPFCNSVQKTIEQTALSYNVSKTPLVCCRVTQSYETGACVYVYFGFIYEGLMDPELTFEAVENAAVEVILSCGGSLSHHHGIGKHRRKWFAQAVSQTGVQVLEAVKKSLDPTNVLGSGNMIQCKL